MPAKCLWSNKSFKWKEDLFSHCAKNHSLYLIWKDTTLSQPKCKDLMLLNSKEILPEGRNPRYFITDCMCDMRTNSPGSLKTKELRDKSCRQNCEVLDNQQAPSGSAPTNSVEEPVATTTTNVASTPHQQICPHLAPPSVQNNRSLWWRYSSPETSQIIALILLLFHYIHHSSC